MAWSLTYDRYDPASEGTHEALTALGNGYFVTRGASADSAADDIHYPGTYLAGGYDRLATEIAGRPVENEDLVNIPNWLPFTFRIEGGDWLTLDGCDIMGYRQELDLQAGLLERAYRLRDGEGRTTRLVERRFVSMSDQHLAGQQFQITAEDWSGTIEIRSMVDGGVVNANVERYKKLASEHLRTLGVQARESSLALVHSRFASNPLELAVATRTRFFAQEAAMKTDAEAFEEAHRAGHIYRLKLTKGEPVTAEKIAAIYTSRDFASYAPVEAAVAALKTAPGFDDLLERHRTAWAHLWQRCDIRIENTSDSPQLKLRVHIFHLLQSVSVHSQDSDIGVPARGWHGEAYRGHIFWDELFIFPFLTMRQPMLTRGLLKYRYRRLDAARAAAQAGGYRGAMYPWQSGSSGREETQTLHLNPQSGNWLPDNSHRQRHINIAVAYNVWSYYQATKDTEFLLDYGAEMILEIARFWASIASLDSSCDRYDIKGVMGPDEYHEAYPGADPEEGGGLDNNAYTNVMAAWVLDRARDVLDILPAARRSELCETLGLADWEIVLFDDVARRLKVPFIEGEDGIIAQFEGYGDLEEFDWQGYREKYGDIQRLDRILEAEGKSPNDYKLSKQADVLMLFYLLSTEELQLLFEQLGYPFKPGMIPRNIDYYIARTSHGSTLSWVVHAWVLTRSDRTRSWHLFQGALDSDVNDIQGGTTKEGIHLGAMAGTVDLVQRCYTGAELRADVLHFNPILPEDLHALHATVRFRRQRLAVCVTHECLRIESLSSAADPVTIAYRGHVRQVRPGEVYEFRLLQPAERRRCKPGGGAGEDAAETKAAEAGR